MMKSGLRPAPPKYQLVFENLRQEILSGQYRAGQKIPSEAHLEKRFGASRITIGRAVRDLCHQGLVERRAGSGTFVRPTAPPLAAASGLSFGLLIPDLGRTEIFEFICQGMAEAPHAQEHALLWCNAMAAPGSLAEERAWQICQQHIARRVSGVFFAPLEENPDTAGLETMNVRILAALKEAGIPVVLLDRDALPFPGRSDCDLVGLDNWRAGLVATNHLLGLGSSHPFFLCSSRRTASSVEERIAGFHAALAARSQPVDPAQVQRLDLEDDGALRQMITEHRPEAVVCANDRTAGRLMQAALAQGLRIPQDLRIIGLDDIPYASLFSVPLTTLRQPCREIGIAAMQTMLERLKQPDLPPRRITLDAALVVRQSCDTPLPPGEEREFLVQRG
ncbi:LacI family DNA-binding transcriptional regulator [Prosthecobacter algae]|uniref:LacI family DNA-binding transcriptional regulator n=1 Tax=Prosthecobacter algae TaxID=1144682 RepID=A0ABP9P7H4_9BACT